MRAKIFSLLLIIFVVSIILLMQLPLLFEPFGPNSQGDTGLWALVAYNHFSTFEQVGWLSDPVVPQPPLMGWLIFLFFKAFGIHDYTVRLFSLIFSVTSSILLFAIVHHLYGRNVAFFSSVIFISHPLTLHVQLVNVLMEVPMITFILASLFCITCVKSYVWRHVSASLFLALAVATKFTAIYFLPIFLLGTENKHSAKQMIYYSLISMSVLGAICLFQSPDVISNFTWRINFNLLFQSNYWSNVYTITNQSSLFSLFIVILLSLFLSENKKSIPVLLSLLAIFGANFLFFTETGTWYHQLFLFVMPLSVLCGKYVYLSTIQVYESFKQGVIYLKHINPFKNFLTAILILLFFITALISTIDMDMRECIGCYDRDIYKRATFSVAKDLQQNDVVVLSGNYHVSSFLEFYLKSMLKSSQVDMISFDDSPSMQKSLNSSSRINVYTILHKEYDSKSNPDLYQQISANFRLLANFTDEYSIEHTIEVYQK